MKKLISRLFPPNSPHVDVRSKNSIARKTLADLVFIHIGKCGGASLWNLIRESEVINRQYSNIVRVHVRKPQYNPAAKYIFVVRNPIERAISAFNWRYKLVVEDGIQKYRFEGEYDTLRKYGSLNKLSQNLIRNNELVPEVAAEFRTIHHLNQDISFYLTDLLSEIRSDQILCVLTQEFLDADVSEFLHIENNKKIHWNRETTPSEKLHLSDLARKNLRCFLEADYAAIRELDKKLPLGPDKLKLLTC